MSIKEAIEIRNELLDRMVDDYREVDIAAVVAENDDKDAPKIVRAILDEIGIEDGAIGEFYFNPSSDEDEIQIFNALLTMTEDIPEDNLPVLYEAMGYINFVLPVGCFAYDKDHNFLIFKLSVSMPISFDKEVVYSLMDTAAGNASSIVDTYMDVLVNVAKGKVSIDEVMGILGGRRE